MLGQGVLRECLLDPELARVQTVGRSATGVVNPKLREVVRKDLFAYSDIEGELKGFDACFFCLGVSSNGMSEADYERMTYQLTLAAAEALARLNPQMTFVYISGTGTDSTEKEASCGPASKAGRKTQSSRSPSKPLICSESQEPRR